MEQNIYRSSLDINDTGGALYQREDSKVKFGWSDQKSSEQEILESQDQNAPQWNQFTDSTTFHGIKYIFDYNASKFRRALWVCCVLMSVGLFLGQVFNRVGVYFSYKSNVLVAVVYEKELPFPAVTICNQNNFRLSKTLESGKLVYKFIDNIYSEVEIIDVKEFNITDYNDTLSKMDLTEFITTTAHQKFDLIDSCRWKGQACNLSDFKTVYTDLGVCYSFNSDQNETKSTNIAGNRGLSIVLNVEQYEYMRGPQNDAGLKILLHHQNDTPMVKDLGFSVAPGTHTEIGINHIKKFSLGSPYGDCQQNAEPLTKCMTQCKAMTAQRMCGCQDLYLEFTEAPICNMEKAFRCVPYATEIGEGDIRSCQCSSPCEQSLYEHSFSFATLSKFNIERVVLNDPNENLRVKKKFLHSKEMAVRTIQKYWENDVKQIKVLLDITSWITENLTDLSQEWADKEQFSLKFKTFDIIFMMEDMIETDKANDLFQERKIMLDCMLRSRIPDTNGECRHSNTSSVISNIANFISNLQWYLFNQDRRPLENVLQDCFNKYGNLELNISSHISSPYTCSYPYYSNTGSTSSGTTMSYGYVSPSWSASSSTTMSPEQKTEQQMSVCRKIVQCKADTALALYNEKPDHLDVVLDLLRSDIYLTKEMILLNTTRTEDDLKKKYFKYEPCLSDVSNLENITRMFSLVTLTEMVKQFQSLRYGQLEDLLNHTRNMTAFFNYDLLYSSFQDIPHICIPWVTQSECPDSSNKDCDLIPPSSITTRLPPIYTDIGKSINKLKDHWMELVPVYDNLDKYLDGTITKAKLTDIFLQPELANKLSVKSDLVKDLIELKKILKETLVDVEDDLVDSYGKYFKKEFDWFTHSSLEEFALIKYLRKIEEEGNLNEKIKITLDQLHQADEVIHENGFENLLKSVFQIRKDHLQYYIDFLDEKTETLLNTNMDKFKENLSEYFDEMKMDENFFMANFLQVDIFYRELKYQKIEQQVAFSLISLFSEVGGFLGLLLGASVLTVCELLDYIALLIISRMHKIKSTKVTALENKNQPPTYSMA